MPDDQIEETTAERPTVAATGEREGLRQELEQAKSKADDHYRSWQRSAADFANFKRRIDEEKRFAERWLLQEILPILDDFDRAWAAAPPELRKFTWVEGVAQVNLKLLGLIERHGVQPIETEGKDFNPLEHEAVMHEDGADLAEQTAVVAELQRGYKLHDRVLRAALVKVGKPKAVAAPAAESDPIPVPPASTPPDDPGGITK